MSGRLVPPPNISQRKRLSDEVASYIRELIMAGVLRPGQIVNIDSFAREIGVSATPVREALMVLVSEGFLLTERHRGFVVAPLDRQDIKDVFEVHASIGGELAARAASRATPEFLAKLEKLQEMIEEALEREDLPNSRQGKHRVPRNGREPRTFIQARLAIRHRRSVRAEERLLFLRVPDRGVHEETASRFGRRSPRNPQGVSRARL